jgi:hypothetical protein
VAESCPGCSYVGRDGVELSCTSPAGPDSERRLGYLV